MGLRAGSYMGFASTSILEVATAGRSAPEAGREGLALSDFLGALAFWVTSFEAVRWAMLRMSLYRAFLGDCQYEDITSMPMPLTTVERLSFHLFAQ